MNPEVLFQIINSVALLGWILLILIPNTKISMILVKSGLLLLFMAAFYAIIIFSSFQADNMQDFNSLAGVMSLFTDKLGVVAGWAHYLAFDLFVGLWITSDAVKRGINRWLLLPCQILTFMFGPMGFLVYYIIRYVKEKSVPANLMTD